MVNNENQEEHIRREAELSRKEYEARRRVEYRSRRWSTLLALITTSVAIGTLTLVISPFMLQDRKIEPVPSSQDVARGQELAQLIKDFEEMKGTWNTQIEVPSDLVVPTRLVQLENRLEKLVKQIDEIGRVIVMSPEKSLELPMLRRDITYIQARHDTVTAALQREINSAYDMMKWVIGSIAFSIVGLGVSIFFGNKSRE